MSEPIIQLADALTTELSTQLAVTVARRYSPYMKTAELVEPKWLLVIAGDDTDSAKRNIVDAELAIDVCLQAAHPDRTDRDDEAIDVDWCDQCVADLGRLKDLFRPGGALRNARIANCDFRRYENSPIFRPDLLLEYGIFTGVVRLIYTFEHNDD